MKKFNSIRIAIVGYAMLVTVLFYFCSCDHIQCKKDIHGYEVKENYIPQSYVIATIKNKGKIIKKNNGLGEGYTLIIQNKDDITEEQTTEEKYNFLSVGDTIK